MYRLFYIISIIFMYIFITTWYLRLGTLKKYEGKYEKYEEKWNLNLSYVVVHIDLKRTPLKLEYLTNLLPTLKGLGANGLLMEYEDMFPYRDNLANLTAKNGYSREKLKAFLNTCNNIGVEVIPLIQTFGHMENALKLKEFRHLREEMIFADSICPSKLESLILIKNILTQVIEFHNSVVPLKHFHIGCDEVFHLNQCKECKQRGQSNSTIFLEHLQAVTVMVKSLSEQINVLFWDDMLRDVNFSLDMLNVPLEAVVWHYGNHFILSHVNLWKYHRKFTNIWIASAFKGADGSRNIIPNVKRRFHNNYNWCTKIRNYKFEGEKQVFNFKGIILTGWSRYKYFDEPCDILPASIPSLFLNLLLFAQLKDGVYFNSSKGPSHFYAAYLQKKIKYTLNCDVVTIQLEKHDSLFHYDNLFLDSCNFTEWNIYKSIEEYLQIKNNFTQVKDCSILKRSSLENEDWCGSYNDKLYDTRHKLLRGLDSYFETDFVTSFVEDITNEHKYSSGAVKMSIWR